MCSTCHRLGKKKTPKQNDLITFRSRKFDLEDVKSKIQRSLIHKTNSDDVEELAKVYNQELSKIYNEACPIITKIARKSSKPWYDLELKDMKKCLIEKERAWKAHIALFMKNF